MEEGYYRDLYQEFPPKNLQSDNNISWKKSLGYISFAYKLQDMPMIGASL